MMKKKLIMVLIIGLLIVSVIPSTIGTSASKKLSTAVCGNGNYNLVVTVKADKKMLHRIYYENVNAIFDVNVSNEGPNISDVCHVKCTITKILGLNSGEVHHGEWVVGPLEPKSGYVNPVNYYCFKYGWFFGVYKIQATIDVNDNNLDDNTGSFIFIVILVP